MTGLLAELILATLAAQVLVLPVIVGHFQQLSLASLPANLLVLPAQPGVMVWGGLATLAYVAWLFLT